MNYEELFDGPATGALPASHCEPLVSEGQLRLSVTRPRRETSVIKVAGPLDLASTPRFAEILRPRLRGTTPALVLDLSEVSFLGGTAIETLLHAALRARTTGQHLTLVTDNHTVDRALQALDVTCQFTYGDPPRFDPARSTQSPAQPVPAPRDPTAAPAEGTTTGRAPPNG